MTSVIVILAWAAVMVCIAIVASKGPSGDEMKHTQTFVSDDTHHE